MAEERECSMKVLNWGNLAQRLRDQSIAVLVNSHGVGKDPLKVVKACVDQKSAAQRNGESYEDRKPGGADRFNEANKTVERVCRKYPVMSLNAK